MNALVLQCGGPTAVVNATLAAIVRRWRSVARGGALHGGRYGLAALSDGDWMLLDEMSDQSLALLDVTPGMILGGGRDRLDDRAFVHATELLASRGVDTLFLIGGNGTMAAGRAVADACDRRRVPMRIIGVPKTIDNDIPCNDVCPGYPSAARFLIETVRDVAADVTSMRGYEDVVLIESMGRHTGWLAAATRLARTTDDEAPHLVLVPEQAVIEDAFLEAVRAQHARAGLCIVIVAEGARDRHGNFLAERCAERQVERDAAGQVILGRSGGPLPYLASLVRERLGLRCRLVRPDVLQRCSRAHVPTLDRTLAALVGTAAVDYAASSDGEAAMVAVRRADEWRTVAVPLAGVQGERSLPTALLSDPSPLRFLLE